MILKTGVISGRFVVEVVDKEDIVPEVMGTVDMVVEGVLLLFYGLPLDVADVAEVALVVL